VREPRDVSIAAGEPDDLAAYVELLEEAGSWLWERGVRQWEPGSNRQQAGLLRRFLESGVLVLARAGDRLAGGCILTRTPTPEWDGRAGDAIYLHKLVVARFAAGRALGQRLLAWSERWTASRGAPLLRLDCWDGNERLRRYYLDAGFDERESVESHGYLVRLFEKPVTATRTPAARRRA
jgi:GNAT superfamily N-acetyltransferase